MFCAYTRPRYQVSVYRTIGPLVSQKPALRIMKMCIIDQINNNTNTVKKQYISFLIYITINQQYSLFIITL